MISAMKKLALATSALALTLSPPAGAETAETSASGPALWKVSDEDTTIYLFGTIHLLPTDLDWMDDEIEAAFNASEELVTEVNMEDTTSHQPQDILALASLEEGQTLRSLMREEDRIEYEQGLEFLDLPAQAFDRFEPWFAYMTLGTMLPMKAGFEGNSGADITLTQMAGDKQREALETMDFQLDLFDGLALEQQLPLLDQTISRIPRSKEFFENLVSYWMHGDVDAIATIMNWGFSDPAVYDRLVSNRNANWAEWIGERLDQPGTVFMAVGAGHLAGRGSVQEQLADRGISTVRVQ
jgi:uncharacterized protein YbaP (TraB family)